MVAKRMKRQSLQKLVVVSLSLNVAIMALLLATLMRSGEIIPAAWAQFPQAQPPLASREVIVAPGQLASNQWGCYVLDTRANTLCIYQYSPGDRMLRLHASRAITHDLMLTSFNTSPQPSEVAELVEKEKRLLGAKPTTAPAMPVEQR
jgi:hypothetical protein